MVVQHRWKKIKSDINEFRCIQLLEMYSKLINLCTKQLIIMLLFLSKELAANLPDTYVPLIYRDLGNGKVFLSA